MGSFGANLGISYSYHAELYGVMMAIEFAYSTGWHKLWLESESLLVVFAFKSDGEISCKLRNIWKNCIALTKNVFRNFTYLQGRQCMCR